MGRPLIIGLDSALWIYLFEDNPDFGDSAEKLFRLIKTGEIDAEMSVIGLIEILTGPKRRGQMVLAARYREKISHFPHVQILGFDEGVVEIASNLRASYRLQTPDAIHVATAIVAGAEVFVTNDRGLRKIKEIPVKLLQDFV
ncbi:MAG: type II toxin-antitoxin system VapC family toxin [Patescibacteria group bacterium]